MSRSFEGLQDNATPLHAAADSGHADVVNMLLEGGADRDARTKVGADRPGEEYHDILSSGRLIPCPKACRISRDMHACENRSY